MLKSTTLPIEQIIPFPQTPQTAREYINAHGMCVSAMARQAGISKAILFDLLNGKLRGQRKKSFQGAVMLGLRRAPTTAVIEGREP
ncbi:MAG: DNA-binding protein [Candidatus Accumulibacter sp.]|nr:DNA-binding protein [Accumulibacter sp.]